MPALTTPAPLTLLRRLLHLASPARFALPASADPSHTMLAAAYAAHGEPSVLQVVDTFPRPLRRPGQVLVRVRAAGVNPVDFKMRRHPVTGLVFPKPQIPGTDLAGEVLEADEEGTFAVGARVFGMMPLLGATWGACAQVAPVDARLLAPTPAHLSDPEAAALPLVGLTVLQGLEGIAVSPGDWALVQAGAGGVGTLAIQYCRQVLGLRVATTCSPQSADLVRGLGAERVIDYHTEDFAAVVRDAAVVVDPLAYRHEARTLSGGVLRAGGTYVNIAGSDWQRPRLDLLGLSIPEAAPDRLLVGFARQAWAQAGLTRCGYRFVFVHPDGPRLRRLADHVARGQVRPVVDRVLPLGQVADAHRYLEQGHARGKVVLEIP